MDKLKKFWKELSVFGIVIVCVLGLYFYRVLTTAEYTEISLSKVNDKITSTEDFVLVTGTEGTIYEETIATYLKKNRGDKVYYLDIANVNQDASLPEGIINDTQTPHTYIYVDGVLTEKRDGAIGYYDFDKLMKNQ